MKNNVFKLFKDDIREAIEKPNGEKARYIWYAGYLFLDLTKRQHNELYDICAAAYGTHKNGLEQVYTETPAGIRLYKIIE